MFENSLKEFTSTPDDSAQDSVCFHALLYYFTFTLCKDIFVNVINNTTTNNSTIQDQKEFGNDQQTNNSRNTLNGDQGGTDQQFEAEGDKCDSATDCTDEVQNGRVVDGDENGKEGIENRTLESGVPLSHVRQKHFLRQQHYGINQCYNK